MTGLIALLFLSVGIREALSQMGLMGPYYVRNGGFFPKTLTNNPVVNYKTVVTPYPENLITGDYYIARKIGPLGIKMTADKKAQGGQNMVNSGQTLTFDDLCNMQGFSLEPFNERFTGTIDDECCLDAGNYTLSKWSIEYHMKPRIESMLYGDYMFHLCWFEKKQVNNCLFVNDINIIFENINKKQAEEKAESGKAKKGKGHKKKKS